jgi:hypothetical protein
MKRLILLFCLIACGNLFGQTKDTTAATPIRKNFKYYFGHVPLKTVHRSAKLDVQLDTRNSFVKDFPINVYGVNVGVILRERFRLGAGYYWINQNFNDKLLGIYASDTIKGRVIKNAKGRVITTAQGIPIPVNKLEGAGFVNGTDFYAAGQQINLWFGSISFMYTFYVSRLIEFAIPIEIGYGEFTEKLNDTSGKDFGSLGGSLKPQPTKGNFVPGQIGFDLLIKPHRWIYFEGSIGYRQTLVQNYTTQYRATGFDSQFNGEYYNVGLKIQLGTIVKDWKKYRRAKKGTPEPVK